MAQCGMPETHVISALVEKRARIDSAIRVRRFQIMRLERELAQVDAVIRMFKPGYDVEAILPKRSFAKNPAGTPRGSGSRHALPVLREAGEPLTVSEIATRVLAKLGKPATEEALAMLANTITSTFSRWRDGAVVYDASTWPGRWALRTLELESKTMRAGVVGRR